MLAIHKTILSSIVGLIDLQTLTIGVCGPDPHLGHEPLFDNTIIFPLLIKSEPPQSPVLPSMVTFPEPSEVLKKKDQHAQPAPV